MRLIKLALTGLIGLAVLLTIMGLLIPSSVKITRGVLVSADSARAFTYLSNTHLWREWMPWMESDSGVVVQVSPEPSQVGSYLKWVSLDRSRKGTLTLTGFKPGTIEVLHQFSGMNDAPGGFRIRRMPGSDQTELQWFIEYPLRWYPWERFYGIFLDHLFGPVLEQGLQRLQQQLESRPELPS
ncbi:MAG TPA: SRPBCC family protein [Lacibacter sp.]|mgnify:CR=1 FL=1|nr:SRPBCC family protein [Lacibacter sp.]HMO89398.1 SRPBCC family protein [Lacibacter sp.]